MLFSSVQFSLVLYYFNKNQQHSKQKLIKTNKQSLNLLPYHFKKSLNKLYFVKKISALFMIINL